MCKNIFWVAKTADSSGTFRIINTSVKVGEDNQHFLHMGLLSHDNKLHNICTQRDHLKCTPHVQVQNKQNSIDIRRHKNQPETKASESEKVAKVNESKDEAVEHGGSMPSPYLS